MEPTFIIVTIILFSVATWIMVGLCFLYRKRALQRQPYDVV